MPRRWVVHTGAPWRWLPHDLPPWDIVYQQTRRWLAAGRTNREIAAELHLAGRTVDAHVSHILGKLGLASRAEVALWVKQHAVVEVAVT